jgi:Fe-S-cluster containining protein
MVIMGLSKSEKKIVKEWINLFKSIISHYECPSECGGACCKECEITLSELEFKRILRTRKDLTEILTQNVLVSSGIAAGIEIKQYELTIHPCPLLENGRCSIHDANPTICNMYPFANKHTTVPGYITLDPCPVGVKIAIDFTIFKAMIDAGSNTKSVYIEEDTLCHLKNMLESSKEYQTHEAVTNIQIPRELLKPFAEFLEKSDKKLRETDRQNVINIIQTL